MAKPTKKNKLLIGGLALLLGVASLIVGFVAYSAYQSRELSRAEIQEKFGCNRIETYWSKYDVFCADNPKLYNDPKSISYKDYYDYLDCDYRIENPPPESDEIITKTYLLCKNPDELDKHRLKFIQNLLDLKSELAK